MIKQGIDVRSGSNTNFIDDRRILRPYLEDIRKFSLLSPEEEHELIKRYKSTGDIEAKNTLISSNMRFAYAVAKRYSKTASTLPDLLNQANIGLIKAIDTFDETRGNRFLSYAVWKIRHQISVYINDNFVIKKTNGQKLTPKINKIKNDYFLKNGRYPTEDEVLEIFNEENDKKIIDRCSTYDIEAISIDSTFNEEDDSTFEKSKDFNNKTASYNEVENTIEDEYRKHMINIGLNCLSMRDRKIIEMSFGIGYDKEYTSEEIGEIMGLTRERIRQIRESALRKMKKPMTEMKQRKIAV